MNRRGFLSAILAAGAAPYVMSGGIGRGVLMPVKEIHVATDEEIREILNGVTNYNFSMWNNVYVDALIYGIGYSDDGKRLFVSDIRVLN